MTYFRQTYNDLPAVLEIPLNFRHRRVEVIILPLEDVIQKIGIQPSLDENGWPLGFFEETFGSNPDLEEREALIDNNCF